jgi:hypothetical protein
MTGKVHGNFGTSQLKRIRGKQEMENIMNCMENSPKTDFWLEPGTFEVKSKSVPDSYFMKSEAIEHFDSGAGMIFCPRAGIPGLGCWKAAWQGIDIEIGKYET